MNKIGLLLLTLFFLSSCADYKSSTTEDKNDPVLEKIAGKDYAKMIEIPTTADGKIDSSRIAKIVFDAESYDFGTLTEGEKTTHTFLFKNEGNRDLYLLQSNASCGCTVPKYSKEAIVPGEKGELKVTFDSSGKKGKQNRKISIISNSFPSENVLIFKGFVKQKESE